MLLAPNFTVPLFILTYAFAVLKLITSYSDVEKVYLRLDFLGLLKEDGKWLIVKKCIRHYVRNETYE